MKVKTTIMVLVIVLLCIGWHSRLHAKTKTPLSTLSYDSELQAVVAAVNQFNPRSIKENREYIGGVLEKDGRYYFTVSAGKVGAGMVTTKLRFSKGMRLMALWHTHAGRGLKRTYFSKVDMQMAHKINKPFYMSDYTGRLKVYFPASNNSTGLPRIREYATGDTIINKMITSDGDDQPVDIQVIGMS